MMSKTVMILILILSISVIYPYSTEELESRLLTDNDRIIRAYRNSESSLFEIERARADRQPSVSGSLSGGYSAFPQEEISIPSASGPVTIIDAQEHSFYVVGLSVLQPLYSWQKLKDAIHIASLNAEISGLEAEQLKRELKAELFILLDSLLLTGEVKQLLREEAVILQRMEDIVRENFQQGFALTEDVETAEIRLKQILLESERTDIEVLRMVEHIGYLCGLEDLRLEEIDHDIGIERLLSLDTEALFSASSQAAADGLPAVRMAEEAVRIRETALSIAENSIYWKPDIAISIDLEYVMQLIPFLQNGWNEKDSLSLTVSLALQSDLWDGGEKLIDQRQARYRLSASIDEQRLLTRSLIHQFEQYLYQYGSTRVSLDLLEHQRSYAQRISSLKRRQHEIGVTDEIEMLSAQLSHLQYEVSYRQQLIELSSIFHAIDAMR